MAIPYTWVLLCSVLVLFKVETTRAFVHCVRVASHPTTVLKRLAPVHAAFSPGPRSPTVRTSMLGKGFGEKSSKEMKRGKSRIPKPAQRCPCYSGKAYGECCKPFHDGTKLPQPQQLMRARYAAYASVMPQYIMSSTHPDHVDYGKPGWREEILKFCEAYRFTGLEVDEPEEDPSTPGRMYVCFTAMMSGADCGRAVSFDEKSMFLLKDQAWYYKEADQEYEASVELISKKRSQRAARANKSNGATKIR